MSGKQPSKNIRQPNPSVGQEVRERLRGAEFGFRKEIRAVFEADALAQKPSPFCEFLRAMRISILRSTASPAS